MRAMGRPAGGLLVCVGARRPSGGRSVKVGTQPEPTYKAPQPAVSVLQVALRHSAPPSTGLLALTLVPESARCTYRRDKDSSAQR